MQLLVIIHLTSAVSDNLQSLSLFVSSGVFGDEVKSVSVMEGDSLTLHTDTKLQTADVIEWRFGNKCIRIARINKTANIVRIYADVLDGRFRDRLQVNNQTGDLTITNITTQHTGLYRVNIRKTPNNPFRFNVTVYDFNIRSNCSLLCSVMNVRDVSLSWYKGNSLLSSISVSDLNIRLSLPLEVEYQDTNTYSCVLNNTITNQTQHLNITHLCQPCSDCVNCCDTTKVVIRLVVSALVGVATVTAVVVLFYDIRSRRAEHERRS
ncbi:uncharacterized protein [Paramisgurnus dabryanus]|uniref:uncharacterized protein n=1 Tax=Paramisgurnus dabryanus TaxID=90735 RepID=UPI003CCEFB9A